MALIDKSQNEYYGNSSNFGDYQFVSIRDIINNFMVAYVGEDKIIPRIKRVDVAFHAQRALAELSFDTFKAEKSQEIEVPATLQMTLPHDYVNYTNIAWIDGSGIQHTIYPATKTNNPKAITQDTDGDYVFGSGNLLINGDFSQNLGYDLGTGITYDSVNKHIDFTNVGKWHKLNWNNVDVAFGESYTLTYTISNYSSGTVQPRLYGPNGKYIIFSNRTANGTYTETLTLDENSPGAAGYNQRFWFTNVSATALNCSIDDVTLTKSGLSYQSESNSWTKFKSQTPNEIANQDYNYDHDDYDLNIGQRYGLDPRFSQTNGSFYIDQENGKIHFSSNISGKTIILKYISDSLGTEEEMRVHKLAEEAMYKCILCNVMMARANVGGSAKMMYKREKFAATRTAKLRLSNLKIEELAQLLRGRSKHIKH
tara:strand:- start:10400 stop:11674 length:1275 start_codon:yes stop_codon:yes gene_type:complete